MDMTIDALWGLVILLFSFAFYFIPSVIASKRGHKSVISIFLTNLFFGWTIIGWIVCIVWSSSSHTHEQPEQAMSERAT